MSKEATAMQSRTEVTDSLEAAARLKYAYTMHMEMRLNRKSDQSRSGWSRCEMSEASTARGGAAASAASPVLGLRAPGGGREGGGGGGKG